MGTQSNLPSKVKLEKMSGQAEKAEEGLREALERIEKHEKDISLLRSASDKEIETLDVKIREVENNSEDTTKKLSELASKISSTSRMIDALDEEVSSLKTLVRENK